MAWPKTAPPVEHLLRAGLIEALSAHGREKHEAGRLADELMDLADAEAARIQIAADERPDDERLGRVNGVIVSCYPWANNADLMEAMFELGYLADDRLTLDPTHGHGTWWLRRRPTDLRAHDLNPAKSPLEPADFRCLPYPDGTFRAIAYDPPYVSVGGRATSTIPDTYDRYGLIDAPTTPAGLQELMNEGAVEMARLLAPTSSRHPSYLLYKCQSYVTNGSFWDGVHQVVAHAKKLGLRQVDQFEMLGRTGAQPKRSRCLGCRKPIQQSSEGPWFDMPRSTEPSSTCPPDLLTPEGTPHRPDPAHTGQDHASRNHSTLLVFEKPKAAKPKAEPTPAML